MRQLSCLLAVAGLCAVAALPTQTDKTLVVARDENNEGDTTTLLEATTSEPLAPIKISEMDVKSEVSLRYSNTAIVTRVRNGANKAQEATFHVLLPNKAFISGFVMTLAGKSYKAYVKEKEEAKQIYNQAVSQGIGAAHIAAKARDSNQFSVSVNVEPNTEAVFNLTYEELLERRNGVYNHVINLHPGTLVPKLTVSVHIKEGKKITTLRVPEIRTGNEIDATETDEQNKNANIEKSDDGNEATITFTPDLAEQTKLMEIYKEKSKRSKSNRPSWYGEQEDEQDQGAEGNLGQFIVQYDVERSNDGEILVNNGYFVHFFAPNDLPPLNKHVVFVLDTSGSMMGRKIDQLKEAMNSILSELRPADYFNIVEFSSDATVHDLKEADQTETKRPNFSFYYRENERQPTTLVPPSKATKENIEKAKILVQRMDANGGTNIDLSLGVAIDLVNKGVEWTPEKGNETKKTEETAEELPKALPLVDPKAVEETPKLEPIIIFLTDGEPTVGQYDTNKIISQVSEKNWGERKAAIFSLAFGEDADRTFLRKLSLLNEAFMRHIYEAADAALQLRDFYRQVSSPLLSNVKFTYPPNQINEKSVTKHNFHTFYRGSEVVIAGKVSDDAELTPEVSAYCGVDDSYTRAPFKVKPKVVKKKSAEYLPLERLWAYLTIKQLLDEKDAGKKVESDAKKPEETPEKRALNLALKYEFVTPLTSLVVVKPNATSAVDAESVDKPENTASGGVIKRIATSKVITSNRGYTGGLKTSAGFHALSTPYLPQPYGGAPVIRPMAISNYMSYAYAAARPPLADPGVPGLAGPLSSDLALDSSRLQEVEEEEDDDQGRGQALSSFSRGAAGPPDPMFSSYGLAGPPGPMYSSYRPAGLHRPISLTPYRAAAGLPGPMFPPLRMPISSHVFNMEAPSTSTGMPTDGLLVYRLSGFPWVNDLLQEDTNTLQFTNNGTTISLKLSTDIANDPTSNESCERAVSGTDAGVCTYLPKCDAAKTIQSQQYASTYYCDINGFAGVCCPKKVQ